MAVIEDCRQLIQAESQFLMYIVVQLKQNTAG